MKICIAGKNSIAVHGLRSAIHSQGIESVLVCPNRTDSGVSDWQPSLVRYAKEAGARVVSLEDIYAMDDLVFISLEFDRLIDPEKFKSKRLFNIHFSKLPAYKGVYTSAWPILNGETESGVTLHRIDHGIDTGELIDQISFPLAEDETARSLYFKYLRISAELFDKNIAAILDGSVSPTPQPAAGSTYYGRSSINYSNLAIDTRQTAASIGRQIRAYSFREFQTPTIAGIPVGRHVVTGDRSSLPPGTITSSQNNAIRQSTIDYDILLYRDRHDELFVAVQKSDYEAVSALITDGCSPNITNKHGWSPLMIATFNGNLKLCNVLLIGGADPNMRNQNGTTPLMYAKEACERTGGFDLCSRLIDAGADPKAKDNFGRSALDYAIRVKQVKAIEFFGAFQ